MVDIKTAAKMYHEKEQELIKDFSRKAGIIKSQFDKDLLAAECFWIHKNHIISIAPHEELSETELQALAWYVRPMLEAVLLKDSSSNTLFKEIYDGKTEVKPRTGRINYGYDPKLEATLERMTENTDDVEELSGYKCVFVAESGYEPDWPLEPGMVKPFTVRKKRKYPVMLSNKAKAAYNAAQKLYEIYKPHWNDAVAALLSSNDLCLGEIIDKHALDCENLMYLDNSIFKKKEYPHYLARTSFQEVVANIMKHEKAEEFVKNVKLPLKAISYNKYSVIAAFEEAMSGSYDEAISMFDSIDYYILDNSWANATKNQEYINNLSKEDLKGAVNFCKGLIYESQGKPMEAYAMYHNTAGTNAYKYGAERECMCLMKINMWGEACNLAKKVSFWGEMTDSDQLMLLLNYPLLSV